MQPTIKNVTSRSARRRKSGESHAAEFLRFALPEAFTLLGVDIFKVNSRAYASFPHIVMAELVVLLTILRDAEEVM